MRTMNEYEQSTRDFAYFGEHGDWLMAYTSANVSDIVTRSNFIAMQRALPEGSFVVEEFKGPLSGVHGGWVLVDPANAEAVAEAEDILRQLEDYPVIDDEVMSELEQDEALESAAAACDLASNYEERKAAAGYILDVSEANNRGVGYSSEYWPCEEDVFFGFLHYRRSLRGRPFSTGKVDATGGGGVMTQEERLDRALSHADSAIQRALAVIEKEQRRLSVELQRIRTAQMGRPWKG